jgi:hypothetical protein
MPGMDRPKQRQVIVAMPGGHCFTLQGQGLDASSATMQEARAWGKTCSMGKGAWSSFWLKTLILQ